MSLVRNSIFNFIVRLIAAAAAFVVSVVVARVLGPEGKGIYSLAILVPSVLGLLSGMGLASANTYFAASKPKYTRYLAGNSLLMAIIFGASAALLFILFLPLFRESLFENVPTFLLIAAAASTPLALMVRYFVTLLLGKGHTIWYNFITGLQPVYLAISMAVILLLLNGNTTAAVWTWISQLILGMLLAIFATALTLKQRWYISWKVLIRSLRYGIMGHFAYMIHFLNLRADLLIVSGFMITAAVGFYSVAANITEMLWYLPTAIATMLLPKLSKMDIKESTILTNRVLRQTFFYTIIGSLLFALITKPFITFFYGAEFSPTIGAIYWLLPGIVIFSLTRVLFSAFAGQDKLKYNFWIALGALAVNLSVNFILIPRMGINGAALASTISYAIATIISLSIYFWLTRTPLHQVLIIRGSDFAEAYRSVLNIFKRNPK
ncbi:oligosaccharide flippase family protein [Patescibacteria group bacterium]